MHSDSNRNIAKNLRKNGKTFSEIGTVLSLSEHAARGLIVYNKVIQAKKCGPRNKIDRRLSLKIKRCISQIKESGKKVNSTKIIDQCNLILSNKTVQRHLKSEGYKYKNICQKMVLSKKHRFERIRIITNWLSVNHCFEKTIFSDEKRFSIDGPDCWRTYIKENDNIIRERRQCQGGGIMIWLMCFPNGLLSYEIIEGYFKSKDYKEMLEKRVIRAIKLNYGTDFYYQDDNCSVHKARLVKDFFEKHRINVLEWPSKSPDINIVEDIWHMISTEVYDGPSFRTKIELKKKLENVIFNINLNRRREITNLYTGIRGRLCTVLKKMEIYLINNSLSFYLEPLKIMSILKNTIIIKIAIIFKLSTILCYSNHNYNSFMFSNKNFKIYLQMLFSVRI